MTAIAATSYICGIDTGGTFTDCVLIADNGAVALTKVPSTPQAFDEGVVNALSQAAGELGLTLEDLVGRIRFFFHGTTVATNIMVERSGAKTGLLTTHGFQDLIFIQRGVGRVTGVPPEEVTRISSTSKPQPIVPKRLLRGVVERIDCNGEVVVQFDEASCRAAVESLLADGVEAIAICFLWAFKNPEHERRAEEIVRGLAPDIFVTTSSALCPKLGEYERTATVAINAFVGPKTQRYLGRLSAKVEELGLRTPILVMQASGGAISADEAGKTAIATLGSGPTGGVIGSQLLGKTTGYPNLIATDMGGTSFEVGLIVDGEPIHVPTGIVDRYEYYSPAIAVTSIGAGGGSIAYIDASGGLRVGPQSAGADPGPACYARGGTQPTVTDADLVLGYLNPEYFLGGKMRLDPAAATAAVERVAKPLGLSIEEAAEGIVRISEFAMADLIRKQTIQAGFDPREFALLAYGGAGPLHAGVFGAELGVEKIIIPIGDLASLWSAWGVASSDVVHVLEQTELMTEPFAPERVDALFRGLESRAHALLEREGVPLARVRLMRSVDMRHRAQVHVVATPVPSGEISAEVLHGVVERFEERYEALFGKGAALRQAGVELIALRVHAVGELEGRVGMSATDAAGSRVSASGALAGRRTVRWSGAGTTETDIYRGELLKPGHEFTGPAIVELATTAVAVHPGLRLIVDGFGNYELTRSG